MTNDPLLPCAHCGCEAHVIKLLECPEPGFISSEISAYAVECMLPSCMISAKRYFNKEDAIKAWNTRLPPASIKWPEKKKCTCDLVYCECGHVSWNACHDAFMKVINNRQSNCQHGMPLGQGCLRCKELNAVKGETPHAFTKKDEGHSVSLPFETTPEEIIDMVNNLSSEKKESDISKEELLEICANAICGPSEDVKSLAMLLESSISPYPEWVWLGHKAKQQWYDLANKVINAGWKKEGKDG